MPLYRPSELRAFLRQEGLAPLKSLSQSFLVDGNVLLKLTRALNLSPQDAVLEIGPGPGVVTEVLHDLGVCLLTVEKDVAFASLISRLPKVRSVHADALKVDLGALVREHWPDRRGIHIVSNLPYRTASRFLRKLMTAGSWAGSLTVMLPQVIYNKLSSSPPHHWLGIASALFCRKLCSFTINRNSYYPRPQCDSVLARWELKSPMPESEAEKFARWLSLAGNFRQKLLRDLPDVQSVDWKLLPCDPQTPLVELPPLMWHAIWSRI